MVHSPLAAQLKHRPGSTSALSQQRFSQMSLRQSLFTLHVAPVPLAVVLLQLPWLVQRVQELVTLLRQHRPLRHLLLLQSALREQMAPELRDCAWARLATRIPTQRRESARIRVGCVGGC